MDQERTNYYAILNISPDADFQDVRRGYVRVKNTYSRDSLALYSIMNKQECDMMLKLVEEAYAVLGDIEKRRAYDESIGVSQRADIQISENHGQESLPREKEKVVHQTSMPKLVNAKKFVLDYVVDPKMEQEIEQTEEFSGPFLKQVREYKNVDIPRMSELIRVSKTCLRQIEEEDFKALPAPVYVRGFVFQYAKCLRLAPDAVSTSFVRRMKRTGGDGG